MGVTGASDPIPQRRPLGTYPPWGGGGGGEGANPFPRLALVGQAHRDPRARDNAGLKLYAGTLAQGPKGLHKLAGVMAAMCAAPCPKAGGEGGERHPFAVPVPQGGEEGRRRNGEGTGAAHLAAVKDGGCRGHHVGHGNLYSFGFALVSHTNNLADPGRAVKKKG